MSVTTAIGAGTWPRTYSSGSTMSISPRSSRKWSRPVTRSASAIAACRQATASWARLVGPMVTAKQYVVA
jgi:hypothetical protein